MVNAEYPAFDTILDGIERLILGFGHAHAREDVRTLRRRAAAEGLSFLTKTIVTLDKALVRGLGSGVFKLPSNFKRRWRGSEIPSFLGSLFSLIFDRTGVLLESASVSAMKIVRQICAFAYKLVTPFKDEVVDRVLENFTQIDSSLPVSIRDGVVIDRARRFTTAVFSKFDKADIVGSHGPGVVSNSPRIAKYSTWVPYSPVIGHFGASFFWREREVESAQFVIFITGYLAVFAGYEVYNTPYKPTAKVVLVPKDSRGPRIISCEPLEHQYAQQGIRKWTQNAIENHPLSRGCVNFEKQEVNQRLVALHSKTKEFSTLDLKDASDRVSLAIVKSLFRDSPDYLEALLASRSTHTLIENTNGAYLLELRKFAPMGSAVCFTTLAWVIFSLISADLSLRGVPYEEIRQGLFVYGDDIVIKTKWAQKAISTLVQHDLMVNVDKSFIDSLFLESCGVDCFDGNPIQPIRLRNVLDVCPKNHTKREALNLIRHSMEFREKVVKTTELANSLAISCYYTASEYYYSLVESWLMSKLPYGVDTSPYLNRVCSDANDAYVRNYDLEFRTGKGPAIRAYVLKTVKEEIPEDGDSRIRRTIRMMGSNNPSDPFSEAFELPEWGMATRPRYYDLKARTLHRFFATAYA